MSPLRGCSIAARIQTRHLRSTPLMVAAGLGTNAPGEDPGTKPEVLDAVKVALDVGNDLNAVDKNGETPLKIAEGVQRGMNIVSSPVTATAIRQVMTANPPAAQ